MTKEKIARINALAKKQREAGLSDDEKAEQAALRREYIDAFRKNLERQLDAIEILEPDGSISKVEKKTWKS